MSTWNIWNMKMGFGFEIHEIWKRFKPRLAHMGPEWHEIHSNDGLGLDNSKHGKGQANFTWWKTSF